ncbi:ArsC family reductase [Thalassotalea mangrovi]|uniref:ArsC family reductase n=1 Tax=Thalassotalea mangrovi TaxID=2572245 RepID=A0A4U1B4K8_9GAMM|nr:ArsC family reductase [Thalassotalea mangrovi]TKB44356.1 ArsC family reductase [Thalassotalea mangrovi]
MTQPVVYGIHNCDTVKKARKWLEQNGIDYQFHDLRKDGINADLINEFVTNTDWNKLVNKRSTTYRQLDESLKQQLETRDGCSALVDHPTLLKRPLLKTHGQFYLGFKADQYQDIFTNE